MSDYEEMLAAISAKRASLLLGTGVTIASTNRTELSWVSLLRRGVEWAFSRGLLKDSLKNRLLVSLGAAESENDTQELLFVAERLSSELRGAGIMTMANWLHENFSSLAVHDRRLVQAIAALNRPILTTNYDTTLESELSFETVTWKNPTRMQTVMTGEVPKAIGHLHGVWREPETVILGVRDYATLLSTSAAQELQRGVYTQSSIIFIGFGAGLDDPNFQSLIDWWRSKVTTTSHVHYRLCRDAELSELQALHVADNVRPISYGDSHSDLPEFLKQISETLNPGNKVTAASPTVPPTVAASRAREHLRERVKDEHIFLERLDDEDERPATDLLIPPVILPLPQEQFAAAQKADDDMRPRRCDVDGEACEVDKLILLAAGEQVGLTSALEWFLDRHIQQHSDVTPMLIDFRKMQKTLKPLETAVRRQALATGVIAGKRDPLPRLALAIDNFSESPPQIFERAVEELKGLPTSIIILGCREGEEINIRTRLLSDGRTPLVRYVGRLNRNDIRALAQLASPTRSSSLTDRAVTVINREHLPRTPFSVGLLLTLLMEKEAYMSTSSETALLDAYVDLLMGRGDPHESAKFTLDAHERSDILSQIAEMYVRRRVGSISQKDFIDALTDYFTEVDWNEEPVAVFNNFHKRRLLTVRGDQVSFSQASYLHLFAAKRAVIDEEFRTFLLAKPLYFSPIIRHYAALTRNDSKLLGMVGDLLDEAELFSQHPTRLFKPHEKDVEAPDNLPDLVEAVFERVEKNIDEHQNKEVQLSRPNSPAFDWLDTVQDEDESPFPLIELESAPPLIKLMTLIVLVSTVLRDSEMVKDTPLKTGLLRRICVLFGRTVDLLDASPEFQESTQDLVRLSFINRPASKARQEEVAEIYRDLAPILGSFGLMSLNLTSRKLENILGRLQQDEKFMSDPHGAIMAALLRYDMQADDWTEWFARAQTDFSNLPAVRQGLMRVAYVAFSHHELSPNSSAALLDALSNNWAAGVKFQRASDRKAAIGRYRQHLTRTKAANTGRVVAKGETVMTEITSE